MISQLFDNLLQSSETGGGSSSKSFFRRMAGYLWGDGSQTREGLSGSGQTLYLDHRTLRRNTRNAEYSIPSLRAVIGRMADSVADTGIIAKADLNHKLLGISETHATEVAEQMDSGFDLWAKSKDPDISGKMTFYQMQRIYARWQQRDNDQFAVLYYGRTPGTLNPLQIAFVDPDQVQGDSITSTHSNGLLRDGIERDEFGREIGFNFMVYDQKTLQSKPVYIPAKSPDGSRIYVLHGFTPEYANQSRGYSPYAHALHKFSKITDFDEAHVQKAIEQAAITAYVKPSKTAPSSDPFEHLLDRQGIRPAGLPDAPTSGATTAEEQSRFYEIPEAASRRAGGLFITNLDSDEDLGQFKNDSPVTNYDVFVDTFLSYLYASNGMPLSIAKMKFLQNYSASMAEIMMFYRVTQIQLNEHVSDFDNPIRNMYLAEEVAAGRLQLRGWSDPYLRRLWSACTWQGAPMLHIDPVKTASANYMNAVMGAHTFDDVALKVNGSSGRANRAKIAKELKEFPVSPFDLKKEPKG